MTELTYDPEFPYVVLFGDWVGAKFPAEGMGKVNAMDYAVEGRGIFVDTTPKPKIPEGAEFIFVEDSDQSVFAYRIVLPGGNNGWMTVGGGSMNDEELLEYIGDGDVTVMVERKDS